MLIAVVVLLVRRMPLLLLDCRMVLLSCCVVFLVRDNAEQEVCKWFLLRKEESRHQESEVHEHVLQH